MDCVPECLDGHHAHCQGGRDPPRQIDDHDALAGHDVHALGRERRQDAIDRAARQPDSAEHPRASDPEPQPTVPEPDLGELDRHRDPHSTPRHHRREPQGVAGTDQPQTLEPTGASQTPAEVPFEQGQIEHQVQTVPAQEGSEARVNHSGQYRLRRRLLRSPPSWRGRRDLREAQLYTARVTSCDRLLEIIDRMPSSSVLLYGDLVLDRFILGTPKRISREAPVIILRFEGQQDLPGGGANALANLATLGVRTIPVAAVGDDEAGHTLVTLLASRGIDTSHIVTVPGFRTPTKVRILGGGGSSLKHQVARYDVEDELPADGPWRDAVAAALRQASAHAGAVAVSDYGYGTVRPDLARTLTSAGPAPCRVCVDSRYRLADFVGVDGATPNLQELEACAGRRLLRDDDVARAAEDLRTRLGARFLLATRGNRGMTLVDQTGPPLHVPVWGTDEVADVTGAGDTVLAVLTAALAAGADPREAAVLANVGGGIVVMKLGTATVSREELARAVQQAPPEIP